MNISISLEEFNLMKSYNVVTLLVFFLN